MKRIKKSALPSPEIPETYLKWIFKNKPHKKSTYQGIKILKNPLDLFIYQNIIYEHNIHWIIETGTHSGGSALFFADALRSFGRNGKVITIDTSEPFQRSPSLKEKKGFSKIELVAGSSVAPKPFDKVKGLLKPGEEEHVLLILDSAHAEVHVLEELDLYVPLLKSGDYVIIEDCETAGPAFSSRDPRLIPDKHTENTFGGATFAKNGFYTVR